MATHLAFYLFILVLVSAGACAPDEHGRRPHVSGSLIEVPGPVPFDTLLARLHAPSPQVRAQAAGALSDSGPRVPDRVRALRRALSDPDWRVARSAAWSLGRIGVPSIPTLVEALSDPRPSVRVNALYAMGKIGQPAASAQSAIRRAASDPDRGVREMAAWILGRFGPRASRGGGAADLGSIADLRAGLAASDPRERLSAVRRFQPFVSAPDESALVLVGALNDPDPGVRAAAADALVALGPPARPALAAALSDSSPLVRQEASVALVRLGASR